MEVKDSPKDEILVTENSECEELQVAPPKSQQSLLFSRPSADENSNKQKVEAKDHKVGFCGSTPDMLSCQPSRDEPKELQVSLKLPAQSKILSPRLPKTPISARISQCTSLQGSSVPLSRYHSVPSALGITALLHDHAKSTKETIDPVILPSSSSANSSAVIDATYNLHSSCVSTQLTVPPPPASGQSSSETSLSKKASVLPPPPATPPPPPPIIVVPKEIDAGHPCPPPSSPSYSRRSLAVMNSNSTPPPPPLPPCYGTSPPTTKTFPSPSPSPRPLPPPSLSGLSASVRNSSSAPPPPPHPPPSTSTCSSSSQLLPVVSVPSPPPLPTACPNLSQLQSGLSVPPPPPGSVPCSKHVASAPPPPPPGFASKGSSANNSICAPPAPPPPAPFDKGTSRDGTASLLSIMAMCLLFLVLPVLH